MLSATEDWLYGDGEDTEKNVYEAKLAELKKIGEPVQERYREHENRRGAFDDFDRAIIVSPSFLFSHKILLSTLSFLFLGYLLWRWDKNSVINGIG